jgi:hypothetical protein
VLGLRKVGVLERDVIIAASGAQVSACAFFFNFKSLLPFSHSEPFKKVAAFTASISAMHLGVWSSHLPCPTTDQIAYSRLLNAFNCYSDERRKPVFVALVWIGNAAEALQPSTHPLAELSSMFKLSRG